MTVVTRLLRKQALFFPSKGTFALALASIRLRARCSKAPRIFCCHTDREITTFDRLVKRLHYLNRWHYLSVVLVLQKKKMQLLVQASCFSKLRPYDTALLHHEGGEEIRQECHLKLRPHQYKATHMAGTLLICSWAFLLKAICPSTARRINRARLSPDRRLWKESVWEWFPIWIRLG